MCIRDRKESEVAISLANKKLFEINNKQQKNKKTLSKLESQSLTASQMLEAQQKLLSRQLYQQYTQGQQSYAQIILQNERPSDIARDVQYFSYVAKARAELISKMQGNLTKINELNDKTALALKEVAELKQKQIDEKKALESQKQAKSKVVSSLSPVSYTHLDVYKRQVIRNIFRRSQIISQIKTIYWEFSTAISGKQ